MKRTLMTMATLLAVLLPAHGLEISHRVQAEKGANVVELTGEKLDFHLSAVRSDDASILVRMTIPPHSKLNKASYLRLEIHDKGKILLWTKLATDKDADGSRSAGFQIHESLVKRASIGISYDVGVKDDSLTCYAYQVPIAEYITPYKAETPK